MPSIALCSPRNLHPQDTRSYIIEQFCHRTNRWMSRQLAISTADADARISALMAAESGRFRAMPANKRSRV